eukprot:Rmarinus@m.22
MKDGRILSKTPLHSIACDYASRYHKHLDALPDYPRQVQSRACHVLPDEPQHPRFALDQARESLDRVLPYPSTGTAIMSRPSSAEKPYIGDKQDFPDHVNSEDQHPTTTKKKQLEPVPLKSALKSSIQMQRQSSLSRLTGKAGHDVSGRTEYSPNAKVDASTGSVTEKYVLSSERVEIDSRRPSRNSQIECPGVEAAVVSARSDTSFDSRAATTPRSADYVPAPEYHPIMAVSNAPPPVDNADNRESDLQQFAAASCGENSGLKLCSGNVESPGIPSLLEPNYSDSEIKDESLADNHCPRNRGPDRNIDGCQGLQGPDSDADNTFLTSVMVSSESKEAVSPSAKQELSVQRSTDNEPPEGIPASTDQTGLVRDHHLVSRVKCLPYFFLCPRYLYTYSCICQHRSQLMKIRVNVFVRALPPPDAALLR